MQVFHIPEISCAPPPPPKKKKKQDANYLLSNVKKMPISRLKNIYILKCQKDYKER